jgi:DNA (cytosine-5)-methyltransferase 1
MNELALFAGAGGGILGGLLLGWRTVCAVEYEPHAAAILAKRQNDGILQPFPIWDDVRTFDGRPWKGIVDVVSGGFPCQDISCAGKGKGIEGKRSGLWSEMSRIVGEVRPRYVLVENSPMLTVRGLGTVLGDLAEMGFDARWGCIGADAAGFPHHRTRFWMVADSNGIEWEKSQGRQDSIRLPVSFLPKSMGEWIPEPPLLGENHGVADLVDRCTRIGNGQVPHCMALAWTILGGGD